MQNWRDTRETGMHSTFNTQKLLMQPKKYPEQEATSEHITLTKWGDTTYKTVTINGRNNTEFLWKLFFPHNYIKFSINHIPLLHSSLSPSKAYRYRERKLYEQIKNSSVILKKSTVLFWQTKYTLAWPGLISKYKKKRLRKNKIYPFIQSKNDFKYLQLPNSLWPDQD